VPPEKQDDYLDVGYFRSGHTVRQTRFLFVEQQMWSTIWSRVPIHTYSLRKSQRKLWRRVNAKFRYEIGPYQEREDQNIVYELYQRAHPLEVGENLTDIFGAHAPTHKFHTHTVRVYDDDKLVAFSGFDVGDDSIASLFGCYLPAYARDSLGTFTMLAELGYGRRRNFSYYHPGYCVPGLAAFNYKLRLPDLEGRHFLNTGWKPMGEVMSKPLPSQLVNSNTDALALELRRLKIPVHRRYMPLCELAPMADQHYGAIPLPVALLLPPIFAGIDTFAGYEPVSGKYTVWFGRVAADLALEQDFVQLHQQIPANSNLKFYEWRRALLASSEVELVAQGCTVENLTKLILREMPIHVLSQVMFSDLDDLD